MNERTTIRLPPEMLRRAKRKAAEDGRTLTSLIMDGLDWVLSGDSQKPKRKRVLPRVSQATGGTWPGVDISNSAEMQEIEDLEYVERMKNGFK